MKEARQLGRPQVRLMEHSYFISSGNAFAAAAATMAPAKMADCQRHAIKPSIQYAEYHVL
jgi:hypothetical protein